MERAPLNTELKSISLQSVQISDALRCKLVSRGICDLYSLLTTRKSHDDLRLKAREAKEFDRIRLLANQPISLYYYLGLNKLAETNYQMKETPEKNEPIAPGANERGESDRPVTEDASNRLKRAIKALQRKYRREDSRPKTFSELMDQNPEYRTEIELIYQQSPEYLAIREGKETPAKFLKRIGILKDGNRQKKNHPDSPTITPSKRTGAKDISADSQLRRMVYDDGYESGLRSSRLRVNALLDNSMFALEQLFEDDEIVSFEETKILLEDEFEWFDDVLAAPIDKAGLILFSNLGYIDCDFPEVRPCSGEALFRQICPPNVFANAHDRFHMQSATSATVLSTAEWTELDESITFLAVELFDDGSGRTDSAYGFHRLISRCLRGYSVIMFRAADSIMLSFQISKSSEKAAIVFSDWYTGGMEGAGQFENMHVAGANLDSATSVMEHFSASAARHYYTDPITAYVARYEIVLAQERSYLLTREDISEAVDGVLQEPLRHYGCDYMEPKYEQLEEFEEAIDFDFLAWNMDLEDEDDSEFAHNDADENDEDDDYESGIDLKNISAIPKEVLDNPIKLLEWINHAEGKTNGRK